MYSSLLLSHNGGINPNCQLVERDRNAYHIIIGLGGAGIDCIRRIKSEVFSTLKPDDTENSVPTYSNI